MIGRVALLLAIAAGVAAADPAVARRKRAPDKFTKAAGEAFAAALEADQRGDLPAALGLYQKAYAISPHPNAIYNTADVQRRLARLSDAIKSYETYLALSPSAADRRDCEAIIAKLAQTPATLIVTTADASDPNAIDLENAYILVDGQIKRTPGRLRTPAAEGARTMIELQVPARSLVVDVVTPITYGQRECSVGPGERRHCQITAAPRIDGSAVINASDRRIAVRGEQSGRSIVRTRFELTAGKHRLMLRDRSYECPALEIDVPKGGALAYVFVSSAEYEGLPRCRRLELERHTLRFGP